ncbi:D-2-hydroxyacid dehydrogenase [Salinisphaera sp. Q1T1-3]|uniref:D-2-hydroxyacid dehydrogenase n=1 Tax=Salinisphaera sp. Q1T1-3 TaxID=2321229 RepID=UPI000E71C3BF|nr:D-2-hydroxyacid dehydrogenase [Salinisphaera sp. Q1T1-3]RJS93745.1 D-2-hydroxyacid dehydrogenase [Salinisphaera sp. Q1T1-3]
MSDNGAITRSSALRITVLTDGDTRPPGLDKVEAIGDVAIAHDEASLRDALPGSQILLVTDFRTAALEAAWDAADALQWIHAASAGVDALMFDALVDSDIPVTNAQGIFDRNIAEYVLGAILMFAKDSKNNIRYQQARRWVHRDTETIENKKLLVVGAGSIGRHIGQLCRAAGMQIAGVARRAKPGDDVFDAIHAQDELDALLPAADYVVVAAPLTEDTEGLFDADRFAAMAPHARFINIGRGAIVDTPALVAALDDARIAGAALDVFDTEPLPEDHPLWQFDNVLISAHMAGDFIGWRIALIDQFLDNLSRWQRQEPLFNLVSKRFGYAPSTPR